jgi:hypothetical protein
MGTQRKIKQIREYLNHLEWSIPDLADAVLEDKYDEFMHNEDKQALADKIKKQLQRTSTKEEVLDNYLRVIEGHISFESLKLGLVRPKYVEHTCIDDILIDELKALSVILDDIQSE